MNYSSLMIVTYGRTGSTLLMGLLNAIPGVLIRGENMNLCLGLFSSYKALKMTKKKHGRLPQDSTKPFFGAESLDEDRFISDARTLLKNQLVPASSKGIECWGFKEIRYTPAALGGIDKYELTMFLNFLAELMPSPGFIFLTRNHEDVAESAFWKNVEKKNALARMALFEQKAKEWSEKRSDCYWIDYEDLIARTQQFKGLFDFIGVGLEDETINAVMSREHSYAGKAENLKNVVSRNTN